MTETRKKSPAEIFAEHGREMVDRAKRILGSEADAEDVVQEVMLSVIRAPHTLDVVERIGNWLYTLVRRRSVDFIRSEIRRRKKETERGFEEVLEGVTPEAVAREDELGSAVARAIGDLPDDLQFAFVENAVEMKPFSRISKETGIPMGTLTARKARAVKTLRAALGRAGYISENK